MRNSDQRSFAFVGTIFFLAVMTMLVVTFSSRMRIEAWIGEAWVQSNRSRSMARNGLEEVMERLRQADRVSVATAYRRRTNRFEGNLIEAPYLYLIEKGSSPTGQIDHPLFSTPTESSGWVDMNRGSESSGGRVGLRDVAGKRQPLPVSWVHVRDIEGVVRGRYAFWVDDESAKIPISVAGRLGERHQHERGTGPEDLSLMGVLPEVGIRMNFLRQRHAAQFPAWGASVLFSNTATVRVWGTDSEAADERGSFGYRRLNLNRWVEESADCRTPGGRQKIVDRVHLLAGWITNSIPTWGNRAHPGLVTSETSWRYALKIAANLQDYLDEDSQPTVLRHDGAGWLEAPDWENLQVGDGAPPLPPMVFGKERVPHVTEYLGAYQPGPTGLRIDHVIEIWNPYTRSFDWSQVGPCRILLSERNEVGPKPPSVADPDLPGEPGNPPLVLELPTQGQIEGGNYGLISTFAPGNPLANSYRVGSPRIFLIPGAEHYPPGNYRLMGDRSSVAADAEMELVVVNSYGYLDLHPRLPQQGAGVTGVVNLRPSDGAKLIATQPFGNVPAAGPPNHRRGFPLDTGDPRSQTEVWPDYTELPGQISRLAWRRQSANLSGSGCFVRLGGGAWNPQGSSGFLPTGDGVLDIYRVPEPMRGRDLTDPAEAPAVLRDGPMTSIGELGFIYDPALAGVAQVDGTVCRGGFRTLSMMPEDAELSQVTEENRAARLIELFTVSDTNRAKINLNSALRDPANLSLRAVFEGFRQQSITNEWGADPGFLDPEGATNAPTLDMELILRALVRAQEERGPMLSVAELLELDEIASCVWRNGLDRGREEFFRRVVELLTVRGTRFTVYVIGQSGQERNGNFESAGTCRLKVRLAVEREYPTEEGWRARTVAELKRNHRPLRHRVKIESWEEIE